MAPISGRALRSARPLVRSALAALAVAAGLGYLVAIWPAPEPFRAPFPGVAVPVADTSFTRPDLPGYVFIGPAAPAVENPCLGVITAWSYTRDRVLTIRRGGEVVHIHPSGNIDWLRPGETPRALGLESLDLLRHASGASCEPRRADDPRAITVETHDAYGRFARTAPGSSDAHAAVDRFLDGLENAWYLQRVHQPRVCTEGIEDPVD